MAEVFGIQFEQRLVNPVLKDKFEMGDVYAGYVNPVFSKYYRLFIKELSPLKLNPPAIPLVTKDHQVIMATASYGKGRVFAVGDPWIYNEYVDGRKLPIQYQNFEAAQDWVKWLLKIRN